MRVWNVILAVILAGAGAPVLVHHHVHGVVNPWQIALAGFLWLNVIICLWELCLLARIDEIEAQHRRLVAAYRGHELELVKAFLRSPVPLARLLSPGLWAGIWT